MPKKILKWLKILIPLLVLLLLIQWIYSTVVGTYNQLISMDESVKTAFSQVQVQYQRRADLIPNLVEVVKGYAKHEKDVLVGVTEARARVGQVNLNMGGGKGITPEAIQQFMEAQGALTEALSRLMVVVERYPELKADQRFAELQAQLEGTENRIAFARNQYNEAVQQFNTYLRRFPNNIIANFFDFQPYPYFEAEKGAEKAPTVKF